jgi:hypothetical protein
MRTLPFWTTPAPTALRVIAVGYLARQKKSFINRV